MTRKNDRVSRALRPTLECVEKRLALSNAHAMQESAAMVALQIVQTVNNVTQQRGLQMGLQVERALLSAPAVDTLMLKTGLPASQVFTMAAYNEVSKDVGIGFGSGGVSQLNQLIIYWSPQGLGQDSAPYQSLLPGAEHDIPLGGSVIGYPGYLIHPVPTTHGGSA
jgi:hypothetical protein